MKKIAELHSPHRLRFDSLSEALLESETMEAREVQAIIDAKAHIPQSKAAVG